MKKDNMNKFNFYVCSFFVYCFIGWIYEVLLEFKLGNGFVNRGFLLGPYLPVYGFGALILILSLKRLVKQKVKIGKISITPLLIFVCIFVITSILEFFTSYFMELIFHNRWWDYSTEFLNINGRICLRTSTIFGIGGMVFIYLIQPILTLLFNKIGTKKLNIIGIIIFSIISLDFIYTILKYII